MGPSVTPRNRSLFAIAAMTIAAICVVAALYVVTESERLDLQTDTREVSDLWAGAARLAATVNSEESLIDDYLLSSDPQIVARFESYALDEAVIAEKMRAGATDLPSVDRAIGQLGIATATWRASFARPAIAAVRAGGSAALVPFTRGSTLDEDSVHAALSELTFQLNLAEGDLRLREDSVSAARTGSTGFGLGALVLSAVLSSRLIRRYRRAIEKDAWHAGILNQFTEVTSFAADDTAIAHASLEALDLLAHPEAGVTHVLNHSQDRAVPEAVLGEAIAEILPLQTLSTCPGMVRRSMHVTSDLGAPLSVHCPVYPAEHGTLACVPLISGEAIGSVHLYWEAPGALALELQRSIGRVAEHAALAIGNRRLLGVLQGQASTDARTGLANSRVFDRALEDALASRTVDEPLAILMLDLDHFKDFNDRHGHPSGDEALRSFADALRSCMRDGDIAARYGGEEFAVILPGVEPLAAIAIAERIRTRTETTILSLAPGITDRITVSIGVACAPTQALERISLLRIADQALYLAKAGGRNRVGYLGEIAPAPDAAVQGGSTRPATISRTRLRRLRAHGNPAQEIPPVAAT